MMERLSLSDIDSGIFCMLLRSVTIFSAWLMKISPSGVAVMPLAVLWNRG